MRGQRWDAFGRWGRGGSNGQGSAGTLGGIGGGGAGRGGAGGGGASAGGAGGAPQPACRTYATAYTYASSLGAVYAYSCSHSETSTGFERHCVQGTDSVEVWADKGAFIDEVAAVGTMRIQSSRYSTYRSMYEYDNQKRVQRVLDQAGLYGTFDAWDSLGRPLHEVMAGSCAGAETTYTYDDAARTTTITTVGGSCATSNTFHYDENMIITLLDYRNGVTATYTTTSTATVCR